MAEIKLNKRYKYAGDIFRKLVDVGLDIEAATAFLNEVEDADVVEVVRCKDCHHLLKDNSDRKLHLCVRERFARQTSLEDYCSNGERKDGEQNAAD